MQLTDLSHKTDGKCNYQNLQFQGEGMGWQFSGVESKS